MELIRFITKISGKTIVYATVLGLFSGVINTGLIAAINKGLFDKSSPNHQMVWIFIGLCVAMLVTRIISQLLLVKYSLRTLSQLQMEISEKVLSAPLQNVEAIGAAKIMTAITADIDILANTLVMIPMLTMQFAILIGCLGYLAWLSWSLFMVLFGVIITGIVLHLSITKKAKLYISKAREAQESLLKYMRDLTDGVKELKLNKRRSDQFLSEHLHKTVETIREHKVKGRFYHVFAQSWGQVLIFIAIGALVFVWPIFQPDSIKTVGAYILIMLYAMGPLSSIMGRLPNISQANISLSKVKALGISLAGSDYVESNTERDIKHTWSSLELHDLYYRYSQHDGKQTFLLGPINLTVQPGELIFFVGRNGSGKSTLAKLLVGLYAPTSGTIEFDGKNIDHENRFWYRQHFSAVFSDYHLFESILGIDYNETTSIETQNFLERFGLKQEVAIDNGMFSTLALSQGQRRRLAMLSAYLEDRPFYVFDEWASDQDPEFKELFYTQLLAEIRAKGKAIFVISHDDSYFHVADRIIMLEHGKVVEQINSQVINM